MFALKSILLSWKPNEAQGFEMYHDEFVRLLSISLDFFQKANIIITGPEVTFSTKSWRLFYVAPLMICHYITLTAYALKIFTEGIPPFEKPDVIPMWLTNTQFLAEIVIVIIKRDSIRDAIISVGTTWSFTGLSKEQMRIKGTAMKRLYYGGLVFLRGGTVVAWQYLLVPLLETMVRRLILSQDVDLRLPFAGVFPFEINNWPVYIAVYTFQVYSMMRFIDIYQGIGWLIMFLTQFVHVKFLLLQEDLIHLKPGRLNYKLNEDLDGITKNEENKIQLAEFVRRHQDTILLAEKLNFALNKIAFVAMLFATLIISFLAVAAKASSGAAYAVNNYSVIIVMLINIFILCYCSQMLSSSSGGIASAAANNLWYNGDHRYQTSIHFIIMRSQKPCCLTLLGFSAISLETFTKVVKTTFSYFSLANHIYDKED